MTILKRNNVSRPMERIDNAPVQLVADLINHLDNPWIRELILHGQVRYLDCFQHSAYPELARRHFLQAGPVRSSDGLTYILKALWKLK